jgi:cell division protein FtsW
VASQTSRLRASRPDYAILVTALALVVVGLIFVYSSSFAIALAAFDDVNYFVVRQAMAAVVGLVAMFALMRIDYRYLRYVSPLLMVGAVLSLAAVLFVGGDSYGARRWIAVGSLPPVQPSEFAKLALIIYISAWLATRGRDVRSFALGVVPFVGLVGVVAALVLMEPDTGTAAVLVMTTVALFFIAGASLTHVITLAGIGGVMGLMLILGSGYRSDRIFAFASAEDDPSGLGFQVLQLLIALGSGGIEGLGLGVSRQKFFYIPGAHTDGVFAIIGEETGFIGAMVVIGLFAYLVYRGFRVALNARDDFGCYLAMGVTCWIAFQALINLGGITRSIPLTGIPLPFVSYGGSSLIAVMAGIGVLLSVSRFGKDRSYVQRPRRREVVPPRAAPAKPAPRPVAT